MEKQNGEKFQDKVGIKIQEGWWTPNSNATQESKKTHCSDSIKGQREKFEGIRKND